MGDKSPKAAQKQANQKASKNKGENDRKLMAAAAKQGPAKKK